ncbi:MAG: hypothetical protein HN542_00655 [Flavobacteriales bacterium]|nr:hypothetical protein [Flavobacteriales bacterium]MBT3964613.1 hypothetical protein [Flavobacteriales bacterium]MBT4705034.1 hypothetical protein [Flavobacteriales bacterium]MBT4929809.1 hypothetical protein [Flavobacteriales bacterium]MBT5976794.1 hypothetical protein [Flavobacteriales bacterium]
MSKLRLNRFIRIVLLTGLFFYALNSMAQVTWDGGASTLLWSDGDNWNPNGVPAMTTMMSSLLETIRFQ